jgi:hypothetical protein
MTTGDLEQVQHSYVGAGDPAAEAAVALPHVVREADLAHLAIADNVDPYIALPRDNVAYGLAHLGVQSSLIDLLSRCHVDHQSREFTGTREAARVGRQDAIGAPLHHSSVRRGAAVQPAQVRL